MLRDFLIPAVLGQEVASPADVVTRFRRVRGHPMARAGLENAVWNLLAQAQGVSLAGLLGGQRERVKVGVSVGIEPTLEALLDRVARYIAEGYGRVKLKIKPGWDAEVVRAVRERWSDLPLQVDANAAYTLADAPVFQRLDQFDLLLIEQPLHYDDIVDHAKLQAQLRTPLCLDESIHSPHHARWALDIEACRVINIKVGRVGGLTAARQIHDLCAERDVPVWCGGMLETNVGRATNVALAALPNFALPGDISASASYYRQDIAEPDFVLNDDSTLSVPSGPGLGVRVVPERLAAYRLRHLARRAHTAGVGSKVAGRSRGWTACPELVEGTSLGDMRRLLVREDLCSGCRACEIACVAYHEGRFGTATARIRVTKIEHLGVDRPHVCRLCQRAPCVAACPTGALYKDETTGAVLLRPDDCTRCSACVDACPFGMAILHPETGLALICDLCGGDPACVKRRATGAIVYADGDGEREPGV